MIFKRSMLIAWRKRLTPLKRRFIENVAQLIFSLLSVMPTLCARESRRSLVTLWHDIHLLDGFVWSNARDATERRLKENPVGRIFHVPCIKPVGLTDFWTSETMGVSHTHCERR